VRATIHITKIFPFLINNKDIDAMSSLWLDDDSIVCVHPMGERLQGRRDVMESWRQIFTSDNTLSFQLKDTQCQQSGRLAVHVLHEWITPDNMAEKMTIVVTTNIYEQVATDSWRMVLHHASLSPATMNQRQQVVDEKDPGTLLH